MKPAEIRQTRLSRIIEDLAVFGGESGRGPARGERSRVPEGVGVQNFSFSESGHR
jgi:hypothetical protein